MKNKLKILIVEDEVITAILLESKLRRMGYLVYARVSTGEEAISLNEEESFDVLLMDIGLAGEIDGIQAAEKIQKIRKTPIIFVTGYQDTETRNRAITLKPKEYLLKPVDMQLLDNALASLLP